MRFPRAGAGEDVGLERPPEELGPGDGAAGPGLPFAFQRVRFCVPFFETYGAPDVVARRFVERVAKLLGGDLGR